jgi:hypothetical protein
MRFGLKPLRRLRLAGAVKAGTDVGRQCGASMTWAGRFPARAKVGASTGDFPSMKDEQRRSNPQGPRHEVSGRLPDRLAGMAGGGRRLRAERATGAWWQPGLSRSDLA